jgi:hypothetical protein
MSTIMVSRVFPIDRADVAAGQLLRGISIYRADTVDGSPGEPPTDGRPDLQPGFCELVHNAGLIAAVEHYFRDRLRQ